MRFRWRSGHLQYCIGRTWEPSRFLRLCCRMGLHFLAGDFQRDGYFCECGHQALLAEHISSGRGDW